jgi:hypothetical protein
MLSVAHAECKYVLCAGCNYPGHHYAVHRFAECHGAAYPSKAPIAYHR